ncbi:NUDIX hydrolase [Streptomyces yaizuensis]|uniref:NUDIX domain-containing protein n=1 Tax=Streptomyces yaizuensis TaxID=2989713 RepID=A0ABQ5NRB2_9ACTN|nr:NUDIX domain-containing protein [Streptomyces sp. YSPA8]GLF92911.1 NUDIX domain-containing protein [Streptomyces sp. YSPA8]
MIDKIAWIHIVDGRVLSTRSRGRTRYYLPGGKREAGESDLDTLVREIKEELSVDLRRETARFAGEFRAQADAHPDGVEVRMRCYECAHDGEPVPSSEIAEVVWLRYADRRLTSPVDQIIFDRLLSEGRLR